MKLTIVQVLALRDQYLSPGRPDNEIVQLCEDWLNLQAGRQDEGSSA